MECVHLESSGGCYSNSTMCSLDWYEDYCPSDPVYSWTIIVGTKSRKVKSVGFVNSLLSNRKTIKHCHYARCEHFFTIKNNKIGCCLKKPTFLACSGTKIEILPVKGRTVDMGVLWGQCAVTSTHTLTGHPWSIGAKILTDKEKLCK